MATTLGKGTGDSIIVAVEAMKSRRSCIVPLQKDKDNAIEPCLIVEKVWAQAGAFVDIKNRLMITTKLHG